MPPKLTDIARRAGVSVTTASNALNDYTKSRIARETIIHVKAIAAEMGYRPNEIARSLKRQRTDTIAFYNGYGLTDFRDRFYGEVLTGIERACANNGVDLLIFCTINQQSHALVFQELTSGKVDGVIVHAPPNNPVANLLGAGSMPAVAIADSHDQLSSVIAENDSGMVEMIDMLWSLGHRDIAFVAPANRLESELQRRKAYSKTMESLGMKPRIAIIDWADSYDRIISVISKDKRPTAICCWNDATAYHMLAVFRASGLRVPEDISVTGFDGFLDGQFPYRRATTVKVPWGDMAAAAVNTLIKMRAGEKPTGNIVYKTILQSGDTTGDVPNKPPLNSESGSDASLARQDRTEH